MNDGQKFGILSTGRPLPVKKSKTHGRLLLDGIAIEDNKPFALLQVIKMARVKGGTDPKRLKIVAMLEK